MQLDDYNGVCGPVQYRRSMSDEFVTYRDSHTFAWIGSMFALSVAWSVGALVVIGLNAAGIAFAVFGVAIGIRRLALSLRGDTGSPQPLGFS